MYQQEPRKSDMRADLAAALARSPDVQVKRIPRGVSGFSHEQQPQSKNWHAVQKRQADQFARMMAPTIRELQAAGVTSYSEMARQLTGRVPGPAGGHWTARAVAVVLEKLGLRGAEKRVYYK